MKKMVLSSAIFFASIAIAQTTNNAEDHAQARPDSTVKAQVLTETQVTKELLVDGVVVAQTVETSVQPSVEIVQIEAPAKSLSAAEVIDASKDLEATMKLMGRNFKALKGADNLAAMAEPATEFSKWASQAEALGIEANAEDQQKYAQGMQHVRKLAADLEIAIVNNDEVMVHTVLNELNETRKEYHQYFDVN